MTQALGLSWPQRCSVLFSTCLPTCRSSAATPSMRLSRLLRAILLPAARRRAALTRAHWCSLALAAVASASLLPAARCCSPTRAHLCRLALSARALAITLAAVGFGTRRRAPSRRRNLEVLTRAHLCSHRRRRLPLPQFVDSRRRPSSPPATGGQAGAAELLERLAAQKQRHRNVPHRRGNQICRREWVRLR